ncbi:MAG: hypothetical protein K8Q97_03210 [Candidatus Andersenbacteria bacterium]|nr:hypothetical protein [Candidatus Andersenbacteria bacterium]
MKILFIGNPQQQQEKNRMNALIAQTSQNGHIVSDQYNGFIKNILAILSIPFTKTNTIHVHTFQGAMLLNFLQFMVPNQTTMTWTLSSLPTFSSHFQTKLFQVYLQFLTKLFDRIVAPTRTLQYQLLAIYGIKSLYIPDGYTKPILNDIQPRQYSLRNNQFGVILSNSIDTISSIAKLYKAVKSKKKLVVFCESPSKEFKKLLKDYPFVTPFALPMTSRGAQSIVRTAGFVIIDDPSFSPLLLQAMDANRVVIATTSPYIEEILGTAGFYYHIDDTAHLSDLMQKSVKNALIPKYSPSLRATHHFTWEKTGLEYEHVYMRKTIKYVPFDSIISKKAFQTAH